MIIGTSFLNNKSYIQLLNDNGEIISTYDIDFPIVSWNISKSKNYLLVNCQYVQSADTVIRFLYVYKLNIEKYRMEFFSKIECETQLFLYDLSPNDKYLALLNANKIITICYFLSPLIDGLYDNSSKIYLEDDMYGGYGGKEKTLLFSPDSSLLITTITIAGTPQPDSNRYSGTISVIFNINDDFKIQEIFNGKVIKFLDRVSILYVLFNNREHVLESRTLPFSSSFNSRIVYDTQSSNIFNTITINENKDILIYANTKTLHINHINLLTSPTIRFIGDIYSYILLNDNEIILLVDTIINKITLKHGIIISIEKIVQLPNFKNMIFNIGSLELFGL